ncbi:hypothetical protein [Streptomyces sp. NPDC008139]
MNAASGAASSGPGAGTAASAPNTAQPSATRRTSSLTMASPATAAKSA